MRNRVTQRSVYTIVSRAHKPSPLFKITAIFLFAVISSDASAQKSNVISDMARFDRTLIPALLSTEDSAHDDVVAQTMSNLVKAWEVFRKTLLARGETNSQWAGGLGRIEDWIYHAHTLDSEPSNRQEVHAFLLKIHDELRTFRQRNDIRYFPDTVVDFREQLDEIATSLKNENFEASHESMSELTEAWSDVTKFRVDKIVYGLDYYRMGEFRAYRETVTASLEALRDAIDGTNLDSAVTEIKTIRTNAMALYKLFGNFED